MYARHSKRFPASAAVALVAALGAADAGAQIPLPTPNDAAAAGACLHLGGLVGCPNNPASSVPLPPGSGSAFFTFQSGSVGTVWNVFGTGSTIFIPVTNFPPFVPPILTPPVVTPTPTPIPTPPVIPPVTTPTTPPIIPPVTTPTTPATPVIANPFTLDPLASITGPARTPPIVRPEYSVREAFAELRIPIVQDPFISELSLTGPRYSDYGLSTTTDTWSYSAGADWAPVRDIRFRGNYSRAVRAPNVQELFSPSSNLIDDPFFEAPPASSISVLPDRGDLFHNLYDDYLGRARDYQDLLISIGAFDIPASSSASAEAIEGKVSGYLTTSLARGFDPNGFGFQGLPIEPIPVEGGGIYIPIVVIPNDVAFDVPFTGPKPTGPIAGDFNADGAVDAADYVVWRNGDGSAEAYDAWRDNFGASSAQGGGIFGGDNATPTIPANRLAGSSLAQGGGVFNAPGSVTISNSTLTENTASAPAGGGIRVDKPLTVSGSTLSNNTVGGAQTAEGGGFRVDKPLAVSGSTLSNNTVGGGSGALGSPQATPPDQNDERAAFIRDQAQSIARRLTTGTPEEQAEAQKNLDQWGNQELKDAVEQAKLELQAPQGGKTAKAKPKAKSKKPAFRSRSALGSTGSRLRTAQIQTDASLSVIPGGGGFAR